MVDDGEFMMFDEVGIIEINLIIWEGMVGVLLDGIVNYGFIDVKKDDGMIVDGGDIVFVFEKNGIKEMVDVDGNVVVEYEGGNVDFKGGGFVSFIFGDYD